MIPFERRVWTGNASAPELRIAATFEDVSAPLLSITYDTTPSPRAELRDAWSLTLPVAQSLCTELSDALATVTRCIEGELIESESDVLIYSNRIETRGAALDVEAFARDGKAYVAIRSRRDGATTPLLELPWLRASEFAEGLAAMYVLAMIFSAASTGLLIIDPKYDAPELESVNASRTATQLPIGMITNDRS